MLLGRVIRVPRDLQSRAFDVLSNFCLVVTLFALCWPNHGKNQRKSRKDLSSIVHVVGFKSPVAKIVFCDTVSCSEELCDPCN